MALHAYDFIAPVRQRIEDFSRDFDLRTATNLVCSPPTPVHETLGSGDKNVAASTQAAPQLGFVDVVIEGGGVKGIATLGSLYALEALGLRFRKIAGTSSGALIAAFLAAAGRSAADAKMTHLIEVLANMDFLAFADGGSDARSMLGLATASVRGGKVNDWLNKSRVAVSALRNLNEMVAQMGLNPGESLRRFLCDGLAELNGGTPLTVGALRKRWAFDPVRVDGKPLEQEFQVIVTDVSHRQKVIFPRELGEYVHNPDDIMLGDIVRASTSIPFFFAPMRLEDFTAERDNLKAPPHITFLDGGIVSNFPLSVFDVPSNGLRRPSCPTFGLLIDEEMDVLDAQTKNGANGATGVNTVIHASSASAAAATIDNPIKLALAMLLTATEHGDKAFIRSSSHNAARIIHITNTIFVGTPDERKVSVIDFALNDRDKIKLFENGVDAALQRLSTWNFSHYINEYRADAKRHFL
jgi:predicted acylesterase/phospholipase RssA